LVGRAKAQAEAKAQAKAQAEAKAEAKAKASTRAKWRFSECTEQYAQKVLDIAGIVRDAMLRQLTRYIHLLKSDSL
jgi:hypothetical protein